MSDGTKTIFVIFNADDVAHGDVDKLSEILSDGRFIVEREAAEADGSVKVYVTGPSDDMDRIIEAFMSGRRTVWLGADPAEKEDVVDA